MSMSNSSQIDWLKLLLQNAAWSGVGDAGGLPPSVGAGDVFIALHTSEPIDGGDQSSNESAYAGYARIPAARDGAEWVDNGANGLQNSAIVQFPQNTGSAETVTWFSLGVSGAGATQYIVKGPLDASLNIVTNLTPEFGIGALDVNAV